MTSAKTGVSNMRDSFMRIFRMQMAEMLIGNGVPLEAWQVNDLIENYGVNEFTDPVRDYVKRFLAGLPRRRGRARSRAIPLSEFRRRIEIHFDYCIALLDFSQADKRLKVLFPRRGYRLTEETPRYRALDLIKTKYNLCASHRSIANYLSLWWRHKVVQRMVCNMMCDHAGIKRRRTPMLVKLADPPPPSPTSSRENES